MRTGITTTRLITLLTVNAMPTRTSSLIAVHLVLDLRLHSRIPRDNLRIPRLTVRLRRGQVTSIRDMAIPVNERGISSMAPCLGHLTVWIRRGLQLLLRRRPNLVLPRPLPHLHHQ